MALPTTPAHPVLPKGEVRQAYDEAAFRHFLAVDRWRAQRSHRPLYLVLVALRETVGRPAQLSDATAAALFRGLRSAIRDVDFVGWYHDGYVIAATLAQAVKASVSAGPVIANRLFPLLQQELSPAQSHRLRLRVVRLGG